MPRLTCPACGQSFAIPETENMQDALEVIEAHAAAHPGHLKSGGIPGATDRLKSTAPEQRLAAPWRYHVAFAAGKARDGLCACRGHKLTRSSVVTEPDEIAERRHCWCGERYE